MLRVLLFLVANAFVCISLSIVAALVCAALGIPVTRGPSVGLFVFSFIFGMSGAFLSLQLSRWMAKRIMGVQLIDANGSYGKIYNKVVDISKRAGLKAMPEVGIWQDSSINAFATGPSKSRSLVALSSGLVSQMSDEEIEAVIAHEIAHIKNGDMVTMAILQGLANTFVVFLSRVCGWAASQAVDEDMSGLVYFVVYLVTNILLFIVAGLVLAWFSRKREFRADEGAARLVGREKMQQALARLKSLLEYGAQEELPEAVAAFGISSSRKTGLAYLWRTHPEIEERIEALQRLV
jgi:heat shock protein HtpX